MTHKVVLVTGGSSGLGKTLCEHLAERGYIVYGTSRKQLPEDGKTRMVNMDVCNPTSVRAAVARIVEKEKKIDIVINNAGIGIAAPLEVASEENIRNVFETNVFGLIRVIRETLPYLRESDDPRIINISSIASVVGLPYRSVYCASKAAVNLLNEALRMEIKPFGVQSCSILAGDIQTPINDHRLSEDCAATVYQKSFDLVHRSINEDVKNGTPTIVFAKKIERILRSKKMHKEYAIGKPMQKFSIKLKHVIPSCWYEKLVMGYSHLR